jgi:hypothetical protein
MKKDGTAAYGTVFQVVFVSADDINLNVNLLSTIRAANLHWIKVAHNKSSEPRLLQERSAANDKRQHKQHKKNEKEYSGNVSCRCRDSTKPENRGDDRNNKKYNSPSQH